MNTPDETQSDLPATHTTSEVTFAEARSLKSTMSSWADAQDTKAATTLTVGTILIGVNRPGFDGNPGRFTVSPAAPDSSVPALDLADLRHVADSAAGDARYLSDRIATCLHGSTHQVFEFLSELLIILDELRKQLLNDGLSASRARVPLQPNQVVSGLRISGKCTPDSGE